MRTLVLVHGAYHGAWCWQKTVSFLCQKGIPVLTPTLSGLGENSYLLSLSVNLSTHVANVVGLLECENLHEVVLVGHSYAGFVITGAAEKVPERIAHLVYLDAFVPESGQKVFDIRPDLRAKVQEIPFIGKNVKVLMPPLPEAFGIVDPEDAAWAKPLLTPTPAACYDEPIVLREPKALSIPRTYLLNAIQASGASEGSHLGPYEKAQGGNWSRMKIPGPHDSMITHPEQLAGILSCFSEK